MIEVRQEEDGVEEDEEWAEIERQLEKEEGEEDEENEEDDAEIREGVGEKEDSTIIKRWDTHKMSVEQKAEFYQRILVSLGFTRYDNGEKGIVCKLRTRELLIGRTFNSQHPTGRFWAKCLADCEFGEKDEFVREERLREIPLVDLFCCIRDGELSMPQPEVTGTVVGRSERAVQVQFIEFGHVKTEWWGMKAIKRNSKGEHFIPAGFSRQTDTHPAKMIVPRDIILPNYVSELERVPLRKVNGQAQAESEEEYVPPEIEAAQYEEVQRLEVNTGKDERDKVVEDMAYFTMKVRETVMPLYAVTGMTHAEINELLQRLAVSALIEYGYRTRNRRY